MPSPEAEKVRDLLYASFKFAGPEGTIQAANGALMLAEVIESIYADRPRLCRDSRGRFVAERLTTGKTGE
jgi:hypothetical protein